MGSGASTDSSCNAVLRLRKALVIRAYNLRQKDETLYDQFRKYAHQKQTSGIRDASAVNKSGKHGNAGLYITMDNVKKCLSLDGRNSPSSSDSVGSDACSWVDDLFQYTLGAAVAEMNFVDFIRFLETGKLVRRSSSSSSSSSSSFVLYVCSYQSYPTSHHPSHRSLLVLTHQEMIQRI